MAEIFRNGNAVKFYQADFKIFGKPTTRPYRRMGIGLTYGNLQSDLAKLRAKAKNVADCIKVD
ncbi:MAG: phosphoribosylglycinamide formyltransferase 2 [Vicingaceae bacterium]